MDLNKSTGFEDFFLFKHILLAKFALREKELIERAHFEITLN